MKLYTVHLFYSHEYESVKRASLSEAIALAEHELAWDAEEAYVTDENGDLVE